MFEGTTDNVGASGPTQGGTTGNVTSGTASEALIRAATAASSAETPAEGAASATGPAATGDTSSAAVTGTHGPKPDATGQPPTTGQPDATGTTEAPPSRIEAAVRNARAAVEKQFEWAKGFTAQDVGDIKQSIVLVRWLKEDPQGFYAALGNDVRIRQTPPQAQPAAQPYKYPKAELRSEDGKGAYSDEQVQAIVANAVQAVKAELMGEMTPIREHFQTEQQRSKQAEAGRRAGEMSKRALTQARTFPHFKENEQAILEKLVAIDPALREEIGPVAAMHLAYNQVLAEVVFPNYEAAADKRIRDEYARKAGASRGQVDGSASAGEGTKPVLNNVDQLARHMERMAAGASV